ncbi:MotA/TolQ/ExbB proton channel family protein [Caulobacter sp.]|uniref:MotA/TolQ/ExbB proton channel family protein n=1 Tax=Caulobacter sp. TaxID=78 RepID=UPI001B1D3469|nr:MotA/TolQ/ExbB proton channel family protein [Caulobacter sp.]MBO9545423.1 MotA/TolQ/ExbB proton channel family protein [Caulobacter sp.]
MWAKALLSQLAGVLFLPVTFALLAIVAWLLVQLGATLREALERMIGRRARRDASLADLTHAAEGPVDGLALRLEARVLDAEAAAQRRLNAVRFAIKVGPSLGLMGTLIPMSAALTGLAKGDLPSLAGNMVIAFSSTVVGIAAGVVAYVLTLVREDWTRRDLDALRLEADRRLQAAEARG